jgi:hypothetical protein
MAAFADVKVYGRKYGRVTFRFSQTRSTASQQHGIGRLNAKARRAASG